MATVQIKRGDGTQYTPVPLDGTQAKGSVNFHVSGATSRTDAIAAAILAYPTHPDDATLNPTTRSARLAGFSDCDGEVWEVSIAYELQSINPIGLTGESFSGANNGFTNSDNVYSKTYVTRSSDLSTCIAAHSSESGPNGEPFFGYSANVIGTTSEGDDVSVTFTYRWPDLRPKILTRTTLTTYTAVTVPGKTDKDVIETALNTDTEIESLSNALNGKAIILKQKHIQEQLVVFWQSNESVVAAMSGQFSKWNDSNFVIAGRTLQSKCAQLVGVSEVDYGVGASPRFFSEITFLNRSRAEKWYSISIKQQNDRKYYYTLFNGVAGQYVDFVSPPTYVD